MSDTSIMSIAQMIDNAFGEADANIVNFKLIQAVLYLLARQLRILERRVKVEIEIDRSHSKTNLSVSELKIRATIPKRKRKIVKSGGSIGVGGENKVDKLSMTTDKSKALEKSASEKSFEKTTSKSAKKSTPYKTSTAKDSSDKSSSEKTKTTSTEKSTTDKSSTEQTSTEKSSTEKSTTDKSSTQKSSTTDKSYSEKSSTEKSSTEKTSTEKSSTEKNSTEKTSTEKSSSEKSSTEKPTSAKSTTDESSTDKTSSAKTTSSSKKSTSTKQTSDKNTSSESKVKDMSKMLELIEEKRERELRIIHQRADSRDVGEISPTPMASLDSVEEQFEKLLVLERIPADEARSTLDKRLPQLSIVTQEQFEVLVDAVRELQNRFAPIATPDFPENAQLMQDLRRGASLTDAMAALQLSARLEAAEKTLKQMLELVTDVAIRSGLEIELEGRDVEGAKSLDEATEISTPHLLQTSKKSKPSKHAAKSTSVQPVTTESLHVSMPSSEPSKIDAMPTPSSVPGQEEKLVVPMDWITYDDLDKAIQSVTDGLMNTLTGLTLRSNANAENAIKIANHLEEKLESSLNLGSRMNDLELLISEYAEQINTLDTSLSSQMTNYQEQLTQMQHDLEAGLEAMAEALANTGGDTAAVTELNTHFTNLQTDIDNANARQKELKESQYELSLELQELWHQIELLRESKADRDEVADALRDKAGLGALNGLVTLQQFDAVRGDFEKRIGAAYDKFNNQEITWQKAIDDLLRLLNDKADWTQLVSLRDDVNKNVEMLRNRTQTMLDIVGEPRSAAITRKLFRDAACLSCSSPAHMDLEESNMIPQLPAFPKPSPRPPTIGAEDSSKPAEDGDHKICYPGLSIPHPIDPRSRVCQRYCGGSHTLVSDKKSRMAIGITVRPALRRVTTGIGSDGKTYMIQEIEDRRKPCLPCNEKHTYTPQPSEAETVPAQDDFDSEMTPLDFLPPYSNGEIKSDNSVTATPPIEDF